MFVGCALESSNLLGDSRLAVSGLVLVNNALACSLVKLLGGGLQCGYGLVLVAGNDSLASCANSGLDLALDRLVALLSLLVGANSLDLRFDVCHVYP
ncbi:MAG: hypothetical protein RLZZ600_1347, partial [Actinomycetota bacterium]